MKLSIFVVVAFLVVFNTADDASCQTEHSCKLEDLGCYNDNEQRAMPEEILNERDSTSKVFGDNVIDWKNYTNYLEGFACRCAKIASQKGYTVIGLQYFGECWSGPNAQDTYNKFGKSSDCINGKFKAMSDTTTCTKYIGKQWSNHVYRIAVPGCQHKQIEPVGCYHDDMIPPRPVPNYIMNERDDTNKGWNGILIDWGNWRTYSPQMICRCAEAASKEGATFFAIQFWGECWSGNDTDIDYKRNGGSTRCRNEYFKKCECNSYNCVGMAHTNYVYKLHGSVKCKT